MSKLTLVEGAAPGTPSAGKVVIYVKADGLVYSKDDAGVETLLNNEAGAGAASQAQQEAGSDLTVFVTPGRQHFHPSAAKVWARFNGTGTAALDSSYNVTSLTDNGTGDYTITIATDLSVSGYSMAGNAKAANTTSIQGTQIEITSPLVGSCRILTANASFAAVDAVLVSVQIFGDI